MSAPPRKDTGEAKKTRAKESRPTVLCNALRTEENRKGKGRKEGYKKKKTSRGTPGPVICKRHR